MLTRVALLAVLGLLAWAAAAPVTSRTLAAENLIVLENEQAGSTGWFFSRLADDANGQIKGYASAASVRQTESITLHITVSPAQTYTIDVYRIGWYAGQGGRLRLHAGPLDGVQQPPCGLDSTTGMIACDWAPSYTFTVPTDWTSGVYIALLTNAEGFQNYVQFVVRDDRPAPFLYQRSIATDQAYNNYPDDGRTGKSLSSFNSFGANTVSGETRAVKVSFDRPYAGSGAGLFSDWEMNFVRWLERSGYDVTYSTDVDTHANGGALLNHKAFLSVGENEYWSKEMFDAAAAARDAGVSLGFFGAAAAHVQARFEPSPAGVPNRVMVVYRDAALDPVQGPTTSTFFRSPPVNRPEQTLRGIQALHTDLDSNAGYVVTDSSHWVYEGTGFVDGDVVPGILGRHVDRLHPDYPPAEAASFTLLSRSPFTDPTGASDFANSSIYHAPSGAWVFSAGTTSWSWGLDDFLHNASDPRIQQTTANILNAFLNGAPVNALSVTAPTTATAGTPFRVEVEAKDISGNRATWYTGTVHFSTSDTSTGVALPPDSTLTNGHGTFSVTLATAGSQTLTVVDAARSLSAMATLTVSTAGPTPLAGLRVAGNRLVDPAGQPVKLRGVARSGTEFHCIHGRGIFDGPSDAGSLAAIKSWGSNVVRVPLNEHCWLGINGVPPEFGGAAYQQAIRDYVTLLNQNGLYAVIDLHWSGPGTTPAMDLQTMPDLDHSPRFWTEVATAFNGNNAVILELFNEPFPDGGQDTVTAWTTWRDGGTELMRGTTTPYQAVGMQTLVDKVRATGATNVIALGGLSWSNSLTQWLTYKPSDPLNNLVAAWHVYNFNLCIDVACFDSTVAPVVAQVPVLVTETGMNACDASFWNTLLNWLDARGSGYLAWTWSTWGDDCASDALVVDYAGTPTTKGQIYKAHLAGSTATRLALATAATPTAGAAFSFTVTAQDQSGNTDSAFGSTVRFTSTDTSPGVLLPVDSVLSGGQGTFTATLVRAGPQTITARDSATGSITGTLSVTVGAASATRFAMATTAEPTSGASFSFTLTALDQFGNTDTGYAGRVHFTSSDASSGVVLPPDSTLTSGQGTFAATLIAAGSQTITATDTVSATNTGTLTVTVAAAPEPAVPLVQSDTTVPTVTATSPPNGATGVATGANVVATFSEAMSGSSISGSTVTLVVQGTTALIPVTVSYDDASRTATLDPTAELSAATTYVATVKGGDAGVKDAAGNALAADKTWTFTTAAAPAPSATRFALSTTDAPTAGQAFSFTVTAKDAKGNTATGYAGRVHFTSSETSSGVVLPPDLTLSNGQGTFSATLMRAGSQTITATDTINATITGTLTVNVAPRPPRA